MSSILSPISAIAWSQEIRVHLPSTSLVGYLRRRSPCACSRTEAPLAQWAPRLNGLSKPGSWRVHTPFSTVAMTVQPTEQCVHTVLTDFVSPAAAGAAPSAFFTMPAPRPSAAVTPPAARPERRRKVRRSMALPASAGVSFERCVARSVPLVFLTNMTRPPAGSELGRLVEFPDMRGFAIAGLRLGRRRSLAWRCAARRQRRASGASHAQQLQELAALCHQPVRLLAHVALLSNSSLAV